MREIKFRAWFRNKMYYGAVQWHPAENGEWLVPLDGANIVTKDAILMQYTGILDKNGKEIYEGDIVQCRKPYDKAVITWRNFDACFIGERKGMAEHLHMSWVTKNAEIIGNIYENPELLNDKQ